MPNTLRGDEERLSNIKKNYASRREESRSESERNHHPRSNMPRTHQRLNASDADEKDRVMAGVSYTVRYMGSLAIASYEGKGSGSTDEAVARIYDQFNNKSYSKCLRRMEFFVSANCVSLRDPSRGLVVFRYLTVNITFCNTDRTHQKAFAFVVKDQPSSSYTVIVVECESTATASDLFAVMSEAFRVRSSLYQAKRLDKAGWTNGLLLSQSKMDAEKLNGRVDVLRSDVPLVIEAGDSGQFAADTARQLKADPNNNNNSFGEFACAVAPPQSPNGRVSEFPKLENGVRWANGGVIHNAAELLVTRVLRERGRSQSMEQVRNGQASGATEDESSMDDFLMFARERSMSVGLNIAT